MQCRSSLFSHYFHYVLLCQNFGFCTAKMVTEPSQDLIAECQLYGHQVPALSALPSFPEYPTSTV